MNKKLRVPQFSADLTQHKYKFDIQIENNNNTTTTTTNNGLAQERNLDSNKGKEV